MRNHRTTEHSQKRRQQRGVNELMVDLISYFGVDHYQKGGCYLRYIPEQQLNELRGAIDRLRNVAMVRGENDNEVTVMHMDRRIYMTKYAA